MEEGKKHIFYGDVICNDAFNCESANGADLKYSLDKLSRIKTKYFVKEVIDSEVLYEFPVTYTQFDDFEMDDLELNKDITYEFVMKYTPNSCNIYIKDSPFAIGGASYIREKIETTETYSGTTKIIQGAIIDWNKESKTITIPKIFLKNEDYGDISYEHTISIPYIIYDDGSGLIMAYDGLSDLNIITVEDIQNYEASCSLSSFSGGNSGCLDFTFYIPVNLNNYSGSKYCTATLTENDDNAKKLIPLYNEVQ